jgi:hypothetical protein
MQSSAVRIWGQTDDGGDQEAKSRQSKWLRAI